MADYTYTIRCVQIDTTSKQGIAVGTWVAGLPPMNFKRYFLPGDTITIAVVDVDNNPLELSGGKIEFFSNNPSQPNSTPFSGSDSSDIDDTTLSLNSDADDNSAIYGPFTFGSYNGTWVYKATFVDINEVTYALDDPEMVLGTGSPP